MRKLWRRLLCRFFGHDLDKSEQITFYTGSQDFVEGDRGWIGCRIGMNNGMGEQTLFITDVIDANNVKIARCRRCG